MGRGNAVQTSGPSRRAAVKTATVSHHHWGCLTTQLPSYVKIKIIKYKDTAARPGNMQYVKTCSVRVLRSWGRRPVAPFIAGQRREPRYGVASPALAPTPHTRYSPPASRRKPVTSLTLCQTPVSIVLSIDSLAGTTLHCLL